MLVPVRFAVLAEFGGNGGADLARKSRTQAITHLRVTLSDEAYVGPGRADLLQAIAEAGSIAAAGRSMGMSYRRAWSLVKALNEGFGRPLVEAERGGAGRGGARLTPTGEEVLRRYRRMRADAERAVAEDAKALRKLVKR